MGLGGGVLLPIKTRKDRSGGLSTTVPVFAWNMNAGVDMGGEVGRLFSMKTGGV